MAVYTRSQVPVHRYAHNVLRESTETRIGATLKENSSQLVPVLGERVEVIRQHAADSATDDEGDIYVIGPHQGKELQLMLRGEKGLARFCTTDNLTPEQVGDLGFEPYVKDGTFKMHVSLSKRLDVSGYQHS